MVALECLTRATPHALNLTALMPSVFVCVTVLPVEFPLRFHGPPFAVEYLPFCDLQGERCERVPWTKNSRPQMTSEPSDLIHGLAFPQWHSASKFFADGLQLLEVLLINCWITHSKFLHAIEDDLRNDQPSVSESCSTSMPSVCEVCSGSSDSSKAATPLAIIMNPVAPTECIDRTCSRRGGVSCCNAIIEDLNFLGRELRTHVV